MNRIVASLFAVLVFSSVAAARHPSRCCPQQPVPCYSQPAPCYSQPGPCYSQPVQGYPQTVPNYSQPCVPCSPLWRCDVVVECQDSGEVHEVTVEVQNPDDEQELHDKIAATGVCGEEYFSFGEPACTQISILRHVRTDLPWRLRFRCETRQGKTLWATVEGNTCGEAEAKGQRIIRYAAIKWHGGVKQGTQPECTILVQPVGAPACGNCR